MEREKIKEYTDLEIEGMRKQIAGNCKHNMTYSSPCKHCKIGRTCKRCYEMPSYHDCNDWETEDLIAAYKLLKEDK